ncbi:MAG TPA: hypothetical protein VFU45_01250 [Gemmatimonadales bacterium]|nr:hypothetical protein [Gemmatimonadales bacterium]
MPVAAITAEWICTRCGTTNRRLVSEETRATADRCVNCHARHDVTINDRPVRWDAKLAG